MLLKEKLEDMKLKMIVIITWTLLYGSDISAANYIWTGAHSTNWNDALNWSPASIPTSTDNVTIAKTGSNNLSIETSPTVANITINSGNTVTLLSGNSLTVNGNFNNSGAFTGASTSTLYFGGTASISGSSIALFNLIVNSSAILSSTGTFSIAGAFSNAGTFTASSGIVSFIGSTPQTMGSGTFYNLNIKTTSNANVSMTGNVKVNGQINTANSTGSLIVGSNTLTLNGTSLAYTSGSPHIDATNTSATVMVSNSLTLSGGGFVSSTINHLTINNNSSVTGNGYTINGVLTIDNGSVLSLSNSLAAGTNFSTSGTGKLQTQSTSSTPIPSNYSYSFTVELNSSVASQSLPKICTFSNLMISNTAGVNETYGSSSTVTINGQLTINSGCTLSMGNANLSGSFTTSGTGILKTSGTISSGNTFSFEVDYMSAFYQTVANGNYTILNLTGGNRTLSSSGVIAVSGTFIAGSGSFITTGSTLSLSNTQSLPSFTYNNLIIAAGNITVSSSIKLTGNLIINNGATFTAPADTLTIAGNFSDSGTFNHNGGTVIFNGVNQVLYGATTFNTFYKLVSTAATLTFPSGKTQTFLNELTLIGAWQNLLTINASVAGQQALLSSTPSKDSLSYLFVTDIRNTNASNIIAMNSTDNGNNIHITFTPATDALADSIVSNLITNPEMAFYEWNLYQQAPVKSINNYCRYTWSQLEPSKGNYDFSVIIAAATAAYNNPNGRGKFSFGVRCLVEGENKDYPAYLDSNMNGWFSNIKQSWVPDWNNAYFLERQDSLAAALGRAFNNDARIGFVQILSYGNWGEWHMAYFESPPAPLVTITNATIEHMINAYTTSFPNKQLVMMSDNAYGLQYAMTRTNVANPIGWYRCSWGNKTMDAFLSGTGWNYAKDRWKTAPVIFEGYGVNSGTGMNYGVCVPQAQKYHVSAIGDWLYGTYATMNQTQRDSVLMSVNLVGYKYVLRNVTLSDSLIAGHNFTVTANWSNTGMAPTYLKWNINYRFIDSISGVVIWQTTSQMNLKSLLPTFDSATLADTPVTVIDHFTFPSNLNPSTYKLEVLITDSANYYAPLQLLSRSRNADSGYTLLTCKLNTIVPTSTWTGNVNSAYYFAGNWLNNAVPDSTVNVLIPAGLPHYPILNTGGRTIINNLTIQNGAAFTVNSTDTLQMNGAISDSVSLTTNGTVSYNGSLPQSITANTFSNNTINNLLINNSTSVTIAGALTIKGTLTPKLGTLITGGYLVFNSDSISTARIGVVTGTIVGNVTVQRYIPSKVSRKYSFMGSSVLESVRDGWQQQIYLTGIGSGGTICGINGTQYNSNGFDATLNNSPSMFTYNTVPVNGSRWVSIPNTTNTNLTPGIGYKLNIRGNRNSNTITCTNQISSSNPAAPESVTLSTTGTVTTGDVTIALNDTTYNKYTLLANPYPSQISFAAFQANNAHINNKMWTYSPFGNGNYTTMLQGIVVNAATGYDNTSGGIIANGQAFFVEANANGNVTFNETHKSNTLIPNTKYFDSTSDSLIRIGLKSSSQTLLDETVIRFKKNGKTYFNPTLDAESFNTAAQSLFILKGNNKIAIATFPNNEVSDTISIIVSSTVVGTYLLTFSDFQSLIGNHSIVLIDNFLHSNQDMNSKAVYSFNITADTASQGNNRFKVVITKSQTLPLGFKDITVVSNRGGVAINWKVTNETNLKLYQVQRSEDGVTYYTISSETVNQKGSYSVRDNNIPSNATDLYYRIQSIDNEGNTVVSKAVSIVLPTGELQVSIFPNPIIGSSVQLHVQDTKTQLLMAIVRDAFGKKIAEQSIATINGKSTNTLLINNRMAEGLYHVQIIRLSDNKLVFETSLIK